MRFAGCLSQSRGPLQVSWLPEEVWHRSLDLPQFMVSLLEPRPRSSLRLEYLAWRQGLEVASWSLVHVDWPAPTGAGSSATGGSLFRCARGSG